MQKLILLEELDRFTETILNGFCDSSCSKCLLHVDIMTTGDAEYNSEEKYDVCDLISKIRSGKQLWFPEKYGDKK